MKAVREGRDLPDYVPDYYADSVAEIDFKLLKKQGITCIAFDADSTLVPFTLLPFKKKTIETRALGKLLAARKLFSCWIIASNRPTNDLQELAKTIDAEVVRASLILRKPRKAYFEKVIDQAQTPPEQIAMVGDKLMADVFGAKRMGMTTVWVKNIGRDNPLDRLLQVRKYEKKLIKQFMND